MNSLEARVEDVQVTEDTLTVDLSDGRSMSVPLAYYPTLLHATMEEREDWAPIGAGYGIEWRRLDYHLSIDGILSGSPEAAGIRRSVQRQ